MSRDILPLRPYQREAIDAVTKAWESGEEFPAIVLATGSGKTVVMAHMISEFHASTGLRSLVLVHRDELATQTMAKLRAVAPHLSVGKVKAQDNEVHADVVVASVQTLARASRRQQLVLSSVDYGIPDIGMVLTDECFPAGTMVGDVPIQDLRVGDLVPSYNETTGLRESRPVVQVMSKRPESLVRITLNDGSSFACTANHPVMTSEGWCPAGGLWRGAQVLSFTHDATTGTYAMCPVRQGSDPDGVPTVELAQAGEGVLRPGLRQGHAGREGRGSPNEEAEGAMCTMRGPRGPLGPTQTQAVHMEPVRSGVLLGRLPGCVGEPGVFRAYGQDQPGPRVGTDDRTESHSVSGNAGQDIGVVEGDGAQAPLAGWQRESNAGTSAQAGGPSGLADGSLGGTRGRRASVPLQSGYSPPDDESVRGGGRGIPLLAGPPRIGSAPGRSPGFAGVDHVEVLEPGRDGTYGGVCSDGLVYNIAVDTTHTYLIGNGVVVHNCHHGVAPSYRKVYAAFPDAHKVGVTATLARGDGIGLGSVVSDVVYTKSIQWMISKGFLVPPVGWSIAVDGLDTAGVKRTGGDYQDGDLGRAMEESDAPAQVAAAYVQHAADRPGVAFWPTVATAHAGADALNALGIRTAVVSGATHPDDRRRIYADRQAGRIQVLSNCMVLSEGFDDPGLSCAVIARPTSSAPLYTQFVGRVLRTFPGKTDALVLDVVGASEDNKLTTLIDMEEGLFPDAKPCRTCHRIPCHCPCSGCGGKRPCPDCREPAAELVLSGTGKSSDLFTASRSAWLRTKAGVMFVPAGDSDILLWPGPDGTWTVAEAPRKAVKWLKLHEGLPLEAALSWAEVEAEDRGEFIALRGASWRKRKAAPTQPQLDMASRMRIVVPPEATKAQVSDLISVAVTSSRVDRYVKSTG